VEKEASAALCGGLLELAEWRFIRRRIRLFPTFALFRSLLPFAATCCTERARKGQRPTNAPPRDNRVLAKDNSLRKLASSGSLSVALNRFAAHSPHARLRAASRAASRPSAVRSSGNAQHLRRQHFHYLHLRLVKASTRKATPSEHISMRGHTTIRRQQ